VPRPDYEELLSLYHELARARIAEISEQVQAVREQMKAELDRQSVTGKDGTGNGVGDGGPGRCNALETLVTSSWMCGPACGSPDSRPTPCPG
jgi:hypothetical protein